MDAGEGQQPFLGSIARAVGRMVELTSQLSAYAKEGKYQEKEIFLSDKLEEALRMLGVDSNEKIKVEKNIDAGQWKILADPNQVLQLLMNLLLNAIEAIGDKEGGIVLTLENRSRMDMWECSGHQQHPSGNYVHLRIGDSGGGIPDKLRESLFEPFVSSKALGRGLGLAAALGIAHNHGGCITAQSIPGRGATFHVFFPSRESSLSSNKSLQQGNSSMPHGPENLN